MSYPQGLSQWLGLTWQGALATVLATAAIYLVFLFATRILGQRLLSSLTTFDTLMVLLFGSIVARTSLGPVPTLSTGIIALATLLILHATLGSIANTSKGDHFLNRNPILLMAGSQLLRHNMRATNTTEIELMSVLREKGIHSLTEIAAVTIEPTGKIAVLTTAKPIDRQILQGIQDVDLIPSQYLRD